MNLTSQGAIRVPGAHLTYERRGSGPLLLLIAGGSGNASGFTGIVPHLAERYTVVTYDRRGAGKSPLDDPHASGSDRSIERHSDDAVALLRALTAEPAYVFGSSAGGLIGLDLVARRPEYVRRLIAHEPTVPGVSAAFDQSQARHLETFRRDGALAAIVEMTTTNGGFDDEWEADVERPPTDMQAATASAEQLFTYTVPAILEYRLDMSAVKAAADKIALASGEIERTQQAPVYLCTAALAERIGAEVITFPGNHTGSISRPRAFAARLGEALAPAS